MQLRSTFTNLLFFLWRSITNLHLACNKYTTVKTGVSSWFSRRLLSPENSMNKGSWRIISVEEDCWLVRRYRVLMSFDSTNVQNEWVKKVITQKLQTKVNSQGGRNHCLISRNWQVSTTPNIESFDNSVISYVQGKKNNHDVFNLWQQEDISISSVKRTLIISSK